MLIVNRYVLDVGQSQDWLALQIALAPCLLGYGEIAKRLHSDPETKREGNIYWKWIENYVAEDYTEAQRVGSGKLSLLGRALHCLSKIPQHCWNGMPFCNRQVESRN